ncbi:LCP family protein [Alkalicella caledoniensis]|uniref:LCP family protein n=1 Tax=Alkalicella caledoniensis TaxID=2731377 RepID=A0A7G9W411_ALKCA|nr:LCP family protein [Alkalicella caledoniensis]QNO13423.1 LCP family protein [Alkalicella caledoniensis]
MTRSRVDKSKTKKIKIFNKEFTKKQIVLIVTAIVLVPLLVYGGTIGVRLWNIYSTISKDIDDFEGIDPSDLDVEEVEGDEIPEDEIDFIKYTDDPIYEQRSPKDPNKLNILLIGTDAVGGQGGHRADTIMVVQFDKTTNKSAILSIPRDTFVKIPGRKYDKINHSYAFGGPRLLKETIEGFLDIHIDHYAQVGFDGFGKIVDSLGGIPVNVQHDMIDSQGGHMVFSKGNHHMNGDQVLTYVRARYLTIGGSDFGRIKRQQEIMVTIFGSIRNNFSLNRTLNMLEAMSPFLRTDVTPTTVMSNWTNFTSVNPSAIELETLQGEGFIYKRIYYYRVPIIDARATMSQLTN